MVLFIKITCNALLIAVPQCPLPREGGEAAEGGKGGGGGEEFELIALSINVPLLCSLWLFTLEV